MEYNPLYMDYTKTLVRYTWIIIISEKWTYLDEIVGSTEMRRRTWRCRIWSCKDWNLVKWLRPPRQTWKRSPWMEVILRAATIKIWVTKIVYSEEREQIEHLKNPRKGDAVKTVMTVLQRRCDKLYRTSYVQWKKMLKITLWLQLTFFL